MAVPALEVTAHWVDRCTPARWVSRPCAAVSHEHRHNFPDVGALMQGVGSEPLTYGPPRPRLLPRPKLRDMQGLDLQRVHDGQPYVDCGFSPLEMLGYDQPRDSHVHGCRWRGLTISERCLAATHSQPAVLLTINTSPHIKPVAL